MQIVIPMSGFGERFRKAGFAVPKPLILVEDRPIIEHVVNLFPNETEFFFICNQAHLDNPDYRMATILKNLCPTGKIIGIAPHKLGPVHAVCQIQHLLDQDQPVVVNYCDFTCYWDWQDFKAFVHTSNCDGAIPAYKGFHPHSLGTTNYAYLQERDGWVLDIQEKQPFTQNRMDEYASSGTYYFTSAKLMIEAFTATVRENRHVGGEFYVSLAYQALLKESKRIAVYPLQHFMQWGTPEDLAEYNAWSRVFRHFVDKPNLSNQLPSGSLIVPMAGLGKRFADEGYPITKPLILVSGKPMAIQAIDDLPRTKHLALVMRTDMPGIAEMNATLCARFPHAIISTTPGLTDGQAATALIGLNALQQSPHGIRNTEVSPVIFGACDNGVLFDQAKYQTLIDNPEVDVIVWGARGHINALRKPQMFGWIDADASGFIQTISVKTPLASPATDPIVIGTFTFKNPIDAKRAIDALIARNGRINGEFYLDSCINDAIALGLRCYLFEVDHFLSWGTPNDLKTFEYWQSCFHKWKYHPYRLELDSRVEPAALEDLSKRYAAFIPTIPN